MPGLGGDVRDEDEEERFVDASQSFDLDEEDTDEFVSEDDCEGEEPCATPSGDAPEPEWDGAFHGAALPQDVKRAPEGPAPPPPGGGPERHPLHRAAYYNDTARLRELLAATNHEGLDALDDKGNSALHVAVLRQNLAAVNALLAGGCAVERKNAGGWSPVEEASALRDYHVVRALHIQAVKRSQEDFVRQQPQLFDTLARLPDFRMRIKWEFGSMLLSPVLSRVAPHDTYEVYKKGTCLRIDGTLKGVDETSTSMLPQWKRGAFSVLFMGRPNKDDRSEFLLLDHVEKLSVDLMEGDGDLLAERTEEEWDKEAFLVMIESAQKAKLKAQEFDFKPVRAWGGFSKNVKREKVEGWDTQVYEATAKLLATQKTRVGSFDTAGTFEEYLDSVGGAGEVEHELVLTEEEMAELGDDARWARGDAAHPIAADDDDRPRKPKKPPKPRSVSGRCWLAEAFPLTVRDLLPILDCMGHANKQFKRVSKFLDRLNQMDVFPVKVKVPLMLTVYGMLTFRGFERREGASALNDDVFAVPTDYTTATVEDVLGPLAGPPGKDGHPAPGEFC